MKKYRIGLANTHSFTEGVNLKWLTTILKLVVVLAIFMLLSIVVSDVLALYPLQFKAYVLYGGLSILPTYLLFYSIKYNSTALKSSIEYQSPKKYADYALSKNELDMLNEKLQELMIEEKPYLDRKLTITKLASMLDIHPKKLSQVINTVYENTFFNFINTHRVNEVKDRMQNPAFKNFSFLGLALDSGFNTKSAFNAAFKKNTGITPSEYKNEIKRSSPTS